VLLSLAGFGLYRADRAGIELDVFLKQPALAAAAVGVMAHRDYELVSVDKYRGTLTLRQTANGQTDTLRPEQVLRGDVVESGRAIGRLFDQSGLASGIPAWVPRYPGSHSQGVIRQDAPGIQKGVATFETSARAGRVAAYYGQALRELGFTVETVSGAPTITLNAAAADAAREVTVAVTPQGTITAIRITFTARTNH